MPGIRQRSDALRNRARVVAAAVSAFDEVGPQVRLEDLAERAGVGVATVYRLFGGRDGLVRAAVEAVFDAEIEPLGRAAARAADPSTALRDVLGATLERVAAHRGLFHAARETRVIGVDVAERYLRDLDDVLGAAQRAGAVRTDVTLRDVAVLLVMVLAVTQDDDPGGADRSRYLALLLDALRPGAPALPPPAQAGWTAAQPPDCVERPPPQ
jgi:AcrR family transcriptional regulator